MWLMDDALMLLLIDLFRLVMMNNQRGD